MCQRFQKDPNSELPKALKASARRKQRQKKMEKASGKQLRAKAFAEYLAAKLDGPREGLEIRPFTVHTGQLKQDVQRAILNMEANKALEGGGIHVEILKTNPGRAAQLITRMWQVIGKTRQIPTSWLKSHNSAPI